MRARRDSRDCVLVATMAELKAYIYTVSRLWFRVEDPFDSRTVGRRDEDRMEEPTWQPSTSLSSTSTTSSHAPRCLNVNLKPELGFAPQSLPIRGDGKGVGAQAGICAKRGSCVLESD